MRTEDVEQVLKSSLRLCIRGVQRILGPRPMTWERALKMRPLMLYAGDLFAALPQRATHIGLSLSWRVDSRTIAHDVRNTMPIPDGSVDRYQAEDVFEHIEYAALPHVLKDIHRVLKPGALFRLSVPDYRCDLLRDRTLRDANGDLAFDPGGGGAFRAGRVVDGGHI